MTNGRTSGIECIGNVAWGTHVCEFYSNREDLASTLVPYFAAGLQQDELCVWVTADPLGAEEAESELRKAVPWLDRYLSRGQIEIWDYRDWYQRGGHFDADRVFGQWVEKEKQATDLGYQGLRATGNTSWVEKQDWPDFMAYEAEVNRVLLQHRMIAVCTYRMDCCAADALLEVVRNHQFVLGQIAGQWEMIENSSLKTATEELRRLNEDLDQLKRLSTRLLTRQDEERRQMAIQLHEVTAQNLFAITMNLTRLQQLEPAELFGVRSLLAECRMLCEQSLKELRTLSYLLHPPILDQVGLATTLHWYIEGIVKRSGIHVELKVTPGIGRLTPETETNLFRIAQEGLSNIVRHSRSSNAIVRLEKQANQLILQFEDFGRGMPEAGITAVLGTAEEPGVGIPEMRERLRQIGGRLEIRSKDQGTIVTASVPVSS